MIAYYCRNITANLRTILCLAFFLACIPAVSQSGPPVRKILAVADFKGEANDRSSYLARTFTVISLRYADAAPCKNDRSKVQLAVTTGNRLSDKSWIKADMIRNKAILAELLSHEQGHYDIGEAFALDLAKKFTETCFSKLNYKTEADSLFKAMNKKYDALQQQYDTETNNMQNRSAQERWKKKIGSMLVENQD